MMKRPSVVEVSGTLNGLEIHKQNEEKYRIAARVDKDKNSILRLIYQDIE